MGKFKQQFTNVPGITDGIYDIGTILEENTKNVDQADVLYKYLENGTRLSTKYYSTKNITHFKNGVVDASQYIKYKRDGYDGLVGLGYFPAAKLLQGPIKNTSASSDLVITLKTDSLGQLQLSYGSTTTNLNVSNTSIYYTPKLITLVVQAGGGAGASGQNIVGAANSGGGGGSGACVSLELKVGEGFGTYLTNKNETIATITLGKLNQRHPHEGHGGKDNIIHGNDCTIELKNGQKITVGGGKGGGYDPNASSGSGFNFTKGGVRGISTPKSDVAIDDTLLNYTILSDLAESSLQWGRGGDAESSGYGFGATQLARPASSSFNIVGSSGQDGGEGLRGGGGGASMFSNGYPGMDKYDSEADADTIYNNYIRQERIGCGGGGGAAFLCLNCSSSDTRYRGYPGGCSALWIYY